LAATLTSYRTAQERNALRAHTAAAAFAVAAIAVAAIAAATSATSGQDGRTRERCSSHEGSSIEEVRAGRLQEGGEMKGRWRNARGVAVARRTPSAADTAGGEREAASR